MKSPDHCYLLYLTDRIEVLSLSGTGSEMQVVTES